MSRIARFLFPVLLVAAGCGGDPQGLDASAAGACLSSDQNPITVTQPLNPLGQARFIVKFKDERDSAYTALVSGAVGRRRLGLDSQSMMLTPQAAMQLSAD